MDITGTGILGVARDIWEYAGHIVSYLVILTFGKHLQTPTHTLLSSSNNEETHIHCSKHYDANCKETFNNP